MARRIMELVELRRAIRKERVFRDMRNPIDVFDDDEVYKRYRFTREGIMQITDLVRPDTEHDTARSHALLPYQQVMIFLLWIVCSSLSFTHSRRNNISLKLIIWFCGSLVLSILIGHVTTGHWYNVNIMWRSLQMQFDHFDCGSKLKYNEPTCKSIVFAFF